VLAIHGEKVHDMGERTLTAELDGGGTIVLVAESVGSTLVADKEIVAKFSNVTSSIERVSYDVLDAVRRAKPSKATVELGFGLAVESGQVVALFGKGKGEATIKVTLEWSPGQDHGSEDHPPQARDDGQI
jgi:hypothetical protein